LVRCHGAFVAVHLINPGDLAMPSSFTSLNYHIVFSTKVRKPLLTDDLRADLCVYLLGIIANKGGQLLEFGGTEDHIHLVTTCSPKMALSDFVRDIKANSSRWLRDEKGRPDFQWQTGYGAFTISYSRVDDTRKYVRNQQEHHAVRSFEDEFRAILERHGIVFNEEYLFEDDYDDR
jgi:putative transposase